MTSGQAEILPKGYTLAEYQIEELLGQGGFGITYLATDTQLQQKVAIKEYFPRQFAMRRPTDSTVVATSGENHQELFQRFLEGFLAEAQTLAQLRHNSIVRVRRYMAQLGTAYMVMDYEEGTTLSKVLRNKTEPATEAEVLGLARPMLDALEAVHARKIFHRDIKPDNIMLRADASPVLLDFGAARVASSFEVKAEGHTAIFTPGYAPPEQVEGTGDQGPWTDIYGFAAVLYHMVALRAPGHSIQRRDLAMPLPPALQIGKGRYDPRLLGAIDWALRLETRARPQSIDEWRRGRGSDPGLDASGSRSEADTILPLSQRETLVPPTVRSAPRSSSAATSSPPVPSSSTTTSSTSRYAAVGGALVAVVALAVGVNVWRGPESSNEPAPQATSVQSSGESPKSPPKAGGTEGTSPPAPIVVPDPVDLVGKQDIAAVGMVDGTLPRYQSNPDLLLTDLRADARQQALEKAVGIFVERAALNEQYDSIRKDLFSHAEFIEQLADDARPRRSAGGLVYLPVKANVRLQDLRRLILRKSRDERIALIRAQGDPLISVSVQIRDAERGSPIERSALAENVIKQSIREFGYRVATPPTPNVPAGAARPDFAIESEAKLKSLSTKLAASGLTITKYVLTSWTVKCSEASSGEDIYFDNQLPKMRSWTDEDDALNEIGKQIADQFSQEFFAQHLPRMSRASELQLLDVASPDAAEALRREMLGLRSVLAVSKPQVAGTTATYAVNWYDQGPGGEQSFDATVLAPLRRKLGAECLEVMSDVGASEVAVKLVDPCAKDLAARLEKSPAAALADAPAGRLESVARSVEVMQQLLAINPEGVNALAARGDQNAVGALQRARAGRVDL